jgi:hypothetical protein
MLSLTGARSLALCFALCVSALSGCAAITPHRLDDTLAAFHDDLRWGRPEWAERAMSQPRRADFQARHAQWGERVRIVDLDPEPARSREGRTFVRTKYTWNFIDEVELRETVVETRWSPGMSDWTCEEERIVSGDPRLFSRPPARPANSTSAPRSSSASAAVRGAL